MTGPALTIKHVHARKLGYGRLGVDLAKHFARLGWEVYDGIKGDDESISENVDGVVEGLSRDVLWVSIPPHARRWYTGQRPHIFTMWEATELPEAMRENLHEFETVLVPSDQNAELFGKYHSNVKVVHLGVELEHWYWRPRPEPGAFFDFLVAGSGSRKGPDLAMEAFHLAFPSESLSPDKPIPRLIHKSPRGVELVGDRVVTVSGFITDLEEIQLYDRCHAYVGPSRGEGFGLQPLQAMAMGLPTIVTDAHGHKAFAHLAHPVRADLVPAGDFMSGPAGMWWEARIDDLVDQMRHVYENYEAVCELAKGVAREYIPLHFSNEAMARRVLCALPRDPGPYDGPFDWHVPDPKLYKVVTTRNWKAEVAGKVYVCEVGQEYYLPADAKRVLFDSNVLDLSCLDPNVDTGLTEYQLAQLGKRAGAERVCPTCTQVIGSGVQAADQLLEKWEVSA